MAGERAGKAQLLAVGFGDLNTTPETSTVKES